MPNSHEGECEAIDPGEPDDTCLDTRVDGGIVEDCRRSDGRCGHFAGPYGCYRALRRHWDPEVDEIDVTNPFNCVPEYEPCGHNAECCQSTHTNVCVPDDFLDAGNPPRGRCYDAEEVIGDPNIP